MKPVEVRNTLHHAHLYLWRHRPSDSSAIGIIGWQLTQLRFKFREHSRFCKRCAEIKAATKGWHARLKPPIVESGSYSEPLQTG